MVLSVSWSELKNFIQSKNTSLQYVEVNNAYYIHGIEGTIIVQAMVPKETPRNLDQIDFEDNYKTASNARINDTNIKDSSSGVSAGVTSDNKLKVKDEDVVTILNDINTNAIGPSTIFKQSELNINNRNENDLSSTSYTVTSGKKLIVTTFSASYDASGGIVVRLKKQTGGTGPFSTQFRIYLTPNGQGQSTCTLNLANGIILGNAGDVFKITAESTLNKGTIWAEFSGSEIDA